MLNVNSSKLWMVTNASTLEEKTFNSPIDVKNQIVDNAEQGNNSLITVLKKESQRLVKVEDARNYSVS